MSNTMFTNLGDNHATSHESFNGMTSKNSRLAVIKTLLHVQNGLSLSSLLDPLLNKSPDGDRAFIHALLLTTLRHWHATARLIDSLADKPIDEIEVRTCLHVGIVQQIYLEVASHASIYETVEALKKLEDGKFARASGLVNAILRKVDKNPAKYRKQCDKKHSLPNWLAKQIKQDWREVYDELTASLRQPAPMFVRVNPRKTSVEEYHSTLASSEVVSNIVNSRIDVALLSKTEQTLHTQKTLSALKLDKPTSVAKLEGFDEGVSSIQDKNAMISGQIIKSLIDDKLDTTKGRVHFLDACTAPSGKLAQCLEMFDKSRIIKLEETKVGVDKDGNDKYLMTHTVNGLKERLQVTAIDNEEKRLIRSHENLARIGLANEVKLICADATSWHDEQPDGAISIQNNDKGSFDVILLDAPCTATGVIRRHPDITLLRQEEDVTKTVNLQKDILDNLWKQLKPQGYFLYVTCSILASENSEQMARFLSEHHDAQEIKLGGDWGLEQTIGRQCLPIDENGGDGFYYALLQKDK